MTNTYSFAERELDILSKFHPDPQNRPIIEEFKDEILQLCEKFGKSGQSGGSAPYTATALSQSIKKLCLQEPLCPVTGIDEEWNDVTEYNDGKILYQNNRCSAIFKDPLRCYYIDAIIWKTQNKHCFGGTAYLPLGERMSSTQNIKSFPFEPKTFYIDVIETEIAPDDWEFTIKNPKQLEKVWKYYDKRIIK